MFWPLLFTQNGYLIQLFYSKKENYLTVAPCRRGKRTDKACSFRVSLLNASKFFASSLDHSLSKGIWRLRTWRSLISWRSLWTSIKFSTTYFLILYILSQTQNHWSWNKPHKHILIRLLYIFTFWYIFTNEKVTVLYLNVDLKVSHSGFCSCVNKPKLN